MRRVKPVCPVSRSTAIHSLLAAALLLSGSVLFCCSEEESSSPKWDGWILPDGVVTLDIRVTSDLGPAPDGLANDPGGPAIDLQSPKDGETVISTTLEVKARIMDSDGVEQQKVKVTLQGQKAETMSLSSTPDVYVAKVDISKLSLKVWFWVEAADTKGNRSSKLSWFKRDPGPTITFTSPSTNERFKSSATVRAVVTDQVEVTSFQAKIGNDVLSLQKKSGSTATQQTWEGTIKFDTFKPPLTGKQVISAEATNKNGAKSTGERIFYVDDEGPTITIKSHSAGSLIGGIISIKAEVKDDAGVVSSSVKCVFGNNPTTQIVTLKSTSATPDIYEGQFDTRALDQKWLWPVMSVRAADKLGNESDYGIQVGLDNGAPIIELDPPPDMHLAEVKDGVLRCSRPFDPVGADAVNDKQMVPQISKIRVQIEDWGNYIPSATYIPLALVDSKTTMLYVLDDTTQALVADTDGDGYCDDVNPEVVPLGTSPKPGQAVAVVLEEIPAQGAADSRPPGLVLVGDGFTYPDGGTASTPPTGCSGWGTQTKAPDPLCLATSATVTMTYTTAAEPVIYTIPPIVSGAKDYKCMGLPFDFLANKVANGWACLAAKAEDTLDNRGVSPPIRVYVNSDPSVILPTDQLPAGAGTPPDCTGTMNKTTGKVSLLPCKFRNPRAGSDPKKNIYVCSTSVLLSFPQMFCHNRVRVQ